MSGEEKRSDGLLGEPGLDVGDQQPAVCRMDRGAGLGAADGALLTGSPTHGTSWR